MCSRISAQIGRNFSLQNTTTQPKAVQNMGGVLKRIYVVDIKSSHKIRILIVVDHYHKYIYHIPYSIKHDTM